MLGPYHWLTPEKGVHQFRFFLPTIRAPILLLSSYAFLWNWDPMCTPSHLGVRIGCHFHKNAYILVACVIYLGSSDLPVQLRILRSTCVGHPHFQISVGQNVEVRTSSLLHCKTEDDPHFYTILRSTLEGKNVEMRMSTDLPIDVVIYF